MKTVIINKADFSIASKYEGSPNQANFGGSWGWAEATTHLVIPEGLDEECIKAVLVPEAGMGKDLVPEHLEIQEDSVKVQAKVLNQRQQKMSSLRSLREPLLRGVDIMTNEITLGIRTDIQAIKEYRQDLLNMTEAFKETDGSISSSIDSLVLASLSLPLKPTP